MVSKDVKLSEEVLENIVYKTFSSKKEVLNSIAPKIVCQVKESLKSWSVNSSDYSAWTYLLFICNKNGAADAIEASCPHFEFLLLPTAENGRVRLAVLELAFDMISNNTSIFNPILTRMVSVVTKVSN